MLLIEGLESAARLVRHTNPDHAVDAISEDHAFIALLPMLAGSKGE